MGTFTAEHRANFADTDAAGIVHYSTIFFWIEATEEALFRELQIPFISIAGGEVTGFPRSHVECDFISPILCGDVVKVVISPIEIGARKIVWEFFANAGERLAAKGKVITVYAVSNGHGAMSSTLIPNEIIAALQKRFGI